MTLADTDNANSLPICLEALRLIVKHHQARKLYWDLRPKARYVLVDVQTAAGALAVYDAISDAHRDRFEPAIKRGPDMLAKIAALAWR